MFDTHCHLFDPPLSPDEIVPRLLQAGVTGIACVATHEHTWSQMIEGISSIKQSLPGAVFGLGVHPWFVNELSGAWQQNLRKLLSNVDAVGEIGLDRGNRAPPFEDQIEPFEMQMAMAREFDKPALLHVVRAHEVVLSHLKNNPATRGIIHAFSGSPSDAKSYIEKGWLLGIGGGIARENAHRLRRVVSKIPIESMVLETDSPYMWTPNCAAGSSWPGEVRAVGEYLAQLKGVTPEELFKVTSQNARELFGL